MTICLCYLRNNLFLKMEIMWDYLNPAQYSAYKEWLEKVEKAEDELFWRDNNLHKEDKQAYNFVNYLEELSILDDLWYVEYVKDFYERYWDLIDDYNNYGYDEDTLDE